MVIFGLYRPGYNRGCRYKSNLETFVKVFLNEEMGCNQPRVSKNCLNYLKHRFKG